MNNNYQHLIGKTIQQAKNEGINIRISEINGEGFPTFFFFPH